MNSLGTLVISGREGFEGFHTLNCFTDLCNVFALLAYPRMGQNFLEGDTLESIFLKKAY